MPSESSNESDGASHVVEWEDERPVRVCRPPNWMKDYDMSS
jgi:hypothetical protein